ncbi:SM-20-related protein [Flavobacteriaceae bacterium MAR_2010_188]|nr:SM-20-related protein [Flavobacteriaceae bacterium MAR_2010_188]
METKFEEIISSFLERRVGISNKFLSSDLAFQLKENLLEHCENENLRLAGIGNNHLLSVDKSVRRDKIFWLDKKTENTYEKEFFKLVDEFVAYLNRTCFTSIRSYEFHYALYEKGAFYKRHLDQFRFDDSRVFSIIMYLNKDWQEMDGGALKIYIENDDQIISPDNQKCVFFKSNELEHEVLLSNFDRMSITGWLKTSI